MTAKILRFRRPLQSADASQRPHLPDLSDEALLAACGTGDSAALGVLFERFHLIVYRTLARYVGSSCSELDDLLQATFLEILRAAPKFQRRSSVRTFLLGIALNVARHHRRAESRRLHAYQGAAAEPPRVSPTPDAGAADAELRTRLSAAIAQLPHDLRVAFVLCDLEEIPGTEVARAIQVAEGTLWRRLHEARKLLRGALGDDR